MRDLSGRALAAQALGMAPPRERPDHLTLVNETDRAPAPVKDGPTLDSLIGQDPVREQLKLLVLAAQARNEPPAHILLSGPGGLGKTTMAHCVATMLGTGFHSTMATSLKSIKDMGKALAKISRGDVLLIDEAHRLTAPVQEVLGLLMMPPYRATLPPPSQLVGAEEQVLRLEPWTLVCATTQPGRLTAPLRSRFGLDATLTPYEDADITTLVLRHAAKLGVTFDSEGTAHDLATRAHGVPRAAERLTERVRDYSQVVMGVNAPITSETLDNALGFNELDSKGLTELDLRILRVLAQDFMGGPTGLKPLATALGEDPRTVEMREGTLVRLGLLRHSSRGRRLSREAFIHLGLKPPAFIGWGA